MFTGLIVAWALGWLLAAAVALHEAARLAQPAYRDQLAADAAEERWRAELADQQHQWVLTGDSRGIYGETFAAIPPL